MLVLQRSRWSDWDAQGWAVLTRIGWSRALGDKEGTPVRIIQVSVLSTTLSDLPDHPILPDPSWRTSRPLGQRPVQGQQLAQLTRRLIPGLQGPVIYSLTYSSHLPGPKCTFGCTVAGASIPEAEFQTSRHQNGFLHLCLFSHLL